MDMIGVQFTGRVEYQCRSGYSLLSLPADVGKDSTQDKVEVRPVMKMRRHKEIGRIGALCKGHPSNLVILQRCHASINRGHCHGNRSPNGAYTLNTPKDMRRFRNRIVLLHRHLYPAVRSIISIKAAL